MEREWRKWAAASGSMLHGRDTASTYQKGCVQFFHLGDQNSHTSNYKDCYEEPCRPVGGCDVAIANSGDCYHHKPVGVEERETKIDTHEVVQQANPEKNGGEIWKGSGGRYKDSGR